MQAEEHPIYRMHLTDREIARLKRRVRPVMALSEAEMVALIPDKTGFRFVGCPHCDAGAQEGQLRWTIRDPHRVQCRYCEMVFPNEQYPMIRRWRSSTQSARPRPIRFGKMRRDIGIIFAPRRGGKRGIFCGDSGKFGAIVPGDSRQGACAACGVNSRCVCPILSRFFGEL